MNKNGVDQPNRSTKISFQNQFVTPLELAQKIQEDPNILLTELKEEKGIFEDSMHNDTILAWDTISRACERRGLEALEGWEKTKKIELTVEEKEILGYCSKFHMEYSELIESSLPEESQSKSELAQYHKNISESIENILERVKNKSKTKTKDKSQNRQTIDDLLNP